MAGRDADPGPKLPYVGNRAWAMDRFVAKANIEHFRRKLAQETNETERQKLIRLLAEEEAKLAST